MQHGIGRLNVLYSVLPFFLTGTVALLGRGGDGATLLVEDTLFEGGGGGAGRILTGKGGGTAAS